MNGRSAGRARAGLVLVLLLFVLLGLPEGVLGTAWPSMRGSFGRPVSSLAWLVSAYTVGYLVSTPTSGHLQERVGISTTLQGGVAATVVGLLLHAVAPGWWVVVLGAAIAGLGAGTVDATANSWCALARGPRAMNLLHAFFGIGATMGPLAVTVVLDLGGSWRLVYAGMVAAESVLFLLVVRSRDAFSVNVDPESQEQVTGSIPRGRLAALLTVFFFYVGAEASYGHWSYSVLTDSRGVSDTVAGAAVAGYWGGLTLGRLVLGVVGERIKPQAVIGLSLFAVVVGALVFWLDPVPGADVVALAWLGLAMAGVFPALVLITPTWLGAANTGRAVGYQLAAASMGVIVVSAAIAALVRTHGLTAVAPAVFAVTLATFGCYQLTQVVMSRAGAHLR